MPHKLAFYVAYLQGDVQPPDQVDLALGMILKQPHLLPADLNIPVPESNWDLDRWWKEVVRRKREEVTAQLLDDFGAMCECCGERLATDLHEVFETRGDDTSWKQIFIFVVDNCALVCQQCHGRAVYSEEFRQKVRVRREVVDETKVRKGRPERFFLP